MPELTGRDLDLIVVGDCNPDVVLTGAGLAAEFDQHERLADAGGIVIGGSAAITAVAAARLGLRVALVAAIGSDPAGQLMLGLLADEGVDTSAVAIRPDLATGLTVALSRGQDRAIITAPGALSTVTAADVPDRLLDRARHLHVSSYFLVERSLGPDLARVLGSARRRGLRTSMDTNFDPAGRWGDQHLTRALAMTDVFLPNEFEAMTIGRRPDAESAAAALRGAGRAVVVKLGERGALALPGDREPGYVVSTPRVQAVDTTGAGDCFNAGLIAGLLRGDDLARAAALGCAVGAACCQAIGGTAGVPSLAEAMIAANAAVIRGAHS